MVSILLLKCQPQTLQFNFVIVIDRGVKLCARRVWAVSAIHNRVGARDRKISNQLAWRSRVCAVHTQFTHQVIIHLSACMYTIASVSGCGNGRN